MPPGSALGSAIHLHVGYVALSAYTTILIANCWGEDLFEYRRGLLIERSDDLWHWEPGCASFPRNAFEVRKDRPGKEFRCGHCSFITAEREAR